MYNYNNVLGKLKLVLNPIDYFIDIRNIVALSTPFLWATSFFNFMYYMLLVFILLVTSIYNIYDLDFLSVIIFAVMYLSPFPILLYTFNLFHKKDKYELLTFKGAIWKIIGINITVFFIYTVLFFTLQQIFIERVNSFYTENEYKKILIFDDGLNKILENYELDKKEKRIITLKRIIQIEKNIKDDKQLSDKFKIEINEYFVNYKFIVNKNDYIDNKKRFIIDKITKYKDLKESFIYNLHINNNALLMGIFICLILSVMSNIIKLNILAYGLFMLGIGIIPYLFSLINNIAGLSIAILVIFLFFEGLKKYFYEILYYSFFIGTTVLFIYINLWEKKLFILISFLIIISVAYYLVEIKKNLLSPTF